MAITSTNPMFGAKHIAEMLDQDPIMARLVKEYITPDRLREVLELPRADEPESIDNALDPVSEAEIDAWIKEWQGTK